MFSGDKLLGGPQAGIIAGTRRALVAPIRRHPLMRALRVDKLTYAALEATLAEHAAGRARETVPVVAMIGDHGGAIAARAAALARAPRGGRGARRLVDGLSTIGGGSAPGSALPTRLVATREPDAAASSSGAAPRRSPPIVARIEHDRVCSTCAPCPGPRRSARDLIIAAMDWDRGAAGPAARPLTVWATEPSARCLGGSRCER